MADQQQELKKRISNLLEEYISTFNRQDLPGAASYYDEPAFIIAASGAKLMPARKDYVSIFTETVERLRSEGWDHSEFIGEKDIRILQDDSEGALVLASCPCKRLKKDGSSVEDFTASYTLRRGGEKGWLILGIHHSPFPPQLR
jgi:ketosteroid isomerase-like protein